MFNLIVNIFVAPHRALDFLLGIAIIFTYQYDTQASIWQTPPKTHSMSRSTFSFSMLQSEGSVALAACQKVKVKASLPDEWFDKMLVWTHSTPDQSDVDYFCLPNALLYSEPSSTNGNVFFFFCCYWSSKNILWAWHLWKCFLKRL